MGDKDHTWKAQLAQLQRLKRTPDAFTITKSFETKRFVLAGLRSPQIPLKKAALDLIPQLTAEMNAEELQDAANFLLDSLLKKPGSSPEEIAFHLLSMDVLAAFPDGWVESNVKVLYERISIAIEADLPIEYTIACINFYRRTFDAFAGSFLNENAVIKKAVKDWKSIAQLTCSANVGVSVAAVIAVRKLFFSSSSNITTQQVVEAVAMALKKKLDSLLRSTTLLPSRLRWRALRVISLLPSKSGIGVESLDFTRILDTVQPYLRVFEPIVIHEAFRAVGDLHRHFWHQQELTKHRGSTTERHIRAVIAAATLEFINMLLRSSIKDSGFGSLVIGEAVEFLEYIPRDKLIQVGVSLILLCDMNTPLREGVYALSSLWNELVPFSITELLRSLLDATKSDNSMPLSPAGNPLYLVLFDERVGEIWERINRIDRKINQQIVFNSLFSLLQTFIEKIDNTRTTLTLAEDAVVLTIVIEILTRSSTVMFTFFDAYTDLLNSTLILAMKYRADVPQLAQELQKLLTRLFTILEKRRMPDSVTLKLLLIISQHLVAEDTVKFLTVVDSLLDFVVNVESKFQYIALHAIQLLYIRQPLLRESLDLESKKLLLLRKKTQLSQHIAESIGSLSEMSKMVGGADDSSLLEAAAFDYTGKLLEDIFPPHDVEMEDAVRYAREKLNGGTKISRFGEPSKPTEIELGVELSSVADPIRVFSDIKLYADNRFVEVISTITNISSEDMIRFRFYIVCSGGGEKVGSTDVYPHKLRAKSSQEFKDKFELQSFAPTLLVGYASFQDRKGKKYNVVCQPYRIPLVRLLSPSATQKGRLESWAGVWNELPTIYVVSVFGQRIATDRNPYSVIYSSVEKGGNGECGASQTFATVSSKHFEDDSGAKKTIYVTFMAHTIWEEPILLALTARIHSNESSESNVPSSGMEVWIGQAEFRSTPLVMASLIDHLDSFISSLEIALPCSSDEKSGIKNFVWKWSPHLPQPRVGCHPDLDTGVEIRNL